MSVKTLNDLRNDFYDQINEAAGSEMFPQTQVDRFINRAQAKVFKLFVERGYRLNALAITESFSVSSLTNSNQKTTITLTNNYWKILSVTHAADSTSSPTPIQRRAMGLVADDVYKMSDIVFSESGDNTIALYPYSLLPSTGNIIVTYIPVVNDMSLDTDKPFYFSSSNQGKLNELCYDLILWKALELGLLKDREKADWARAEFLDELESLGMQGSSLLTEIQDTNCY